MCVCILRKDDKWILQACQRADFVEAEGRKYVFYRNMKKTSSMFTFRGVVIIRLIKIFIIYYSV